ncbi:hypothetical protein KC323_g124 [Hortaea werneckii]|nr:hypothetical protein KC323_g124 [Hortaea werneckii]
MLISCDAHDLYQNVGSGVSIHVYEAALTSAVDRLLGPKVSLAFTVLVDGFALEILNFCLEAWFSGSQHRPWHRQRWLPSAPERKPCLQP